MILRWQKKGEDEYWLFDGDGRPPSIGLTHEANDGWGKWRMESSTSADFVLYWSDDQVVDDAKDRARIQAMSCIEAIVRILRTKPDGGA